MKAIVTGSNGFVGPHLVEHLRSCGDDVLGLTQTSGPDLTERSAWIDAVESARPDVIYHLAGWSDVGASWQNPDKTAEINTMGSVAILEAARQASSPPRVLLISSADVYGRVDPSDLPLTEESPARPCSPYGGSKQAAESLALQNFRGFGLETIVARPFNHIGPGQATKFIAASFAQQIANAEQAGSGSITHGDLNPLRDISDVRDVVKAYRLLATDGVAGEIYNVCSGSMTAMSTLLNEMVGLATVDISTKVDPALLRPVELPALEGSYQKLADATGWKPTISLSTTLQDILAEARTALHQPASHDQPTPGENT